MKHFRSISIVLVLLFFLPGFSKAQKTGFDLSYHFLKSGNIVQDQDFYFFTLMEKLPPVRQLLSRDPVLSEFLDQSKVRLSDATLCPELWCFVDPFNWRNDEIHVYGNRLLEVLGKHPDVLKELADNMRKSGYFIRYSPLNDTAMVRRAWEDGTGNMNYIMEAYTTNHGLLYPDIDSTTFNVKGEHYEMLIQQTFLLLNHFKDSMNLFFQPSLGLSMDLLNLNYRDEAARFEPLDSTNALAYSRIPHINWNKYPYSVILLPGEGPVNNKPISPLGKYRCILGAQQYNRGMAPFIVVSGGFVHPFQTPYCEAFEMKKYLVEQLGVPASAVIMEPHARHTTTNIRNTNRILYRHRIPADKEILCTTTNEQLLYILSNQFEERCVRIMGYVPWKEMQQIDDFNLSFYPVEASLQMDASDPLDP